ncbi:hypothetical protein CLHOM_17750 [Clostridium homopropionicum DSM 5847]|uniref:Uncharacterized protein n=1 Tax=Clostridium homopropionicum DSM 5847 TaxID=1121318 RepID=A0A0L6Z9P9_9CLOT|nr:DUF6143 family protein [Clostridium homopropionicum]KOA19686.1 hypothetical protein CLHOM_17750 [Clostridium homopropionicum DSM 5847]SFF80057.1 hypothetical protein SAMN04488501_102219 [Clostridium homopropionicum]
MPEKISNQLVEIVNITSPALNSRLGRYFIGQTGLLNFGNGYNAWGGIINPINSGVNLYFDIFTITNFSTQSFMGEIWLNADAPKNAVISSTVTPSNQGISPAPIPKSVMKYADYFTGPMTRGVNIFGRIVSPNSTLVSDSHNGSIIIGPGGSFSILIRPLESECITCTIVLTWWEEAI